MRHVLGALVPEAEGDEFIGGPERAVKEYALRAVDHRDNRRGEGGDAGEINERTAVDAIAQQKSDVVLGGRSKAPPQVQRRLPGNCDRLDVKPARAPIEIFELLGLPRRKAAPGCLPGEALEGCVERIALGKTAPHLLSRVDLQRMRLAQ